MTAPVHIPAAALGKLKERWELKKDYTVDPRGWTRDRLPGVVVWSKQTTIMESVRDNAQTAVQSCHSAGKSFISALIACWWLDSHKDGEAFVVTSAPTGDQVKAILWREINRTHKRGGLRGRTNLTEWYIGEELVAMGRKPNEYDPTSFQGIHARFVLVILDEACGMPEALWEAASSLTSNHHSRTLAIGNPDDPSSHFKEVCEMETWNNIRISAFDTPNFTGEPVPELLHDVLVAPSWVDRKRIEWTELSPLWVSKILGKFPEDAEDGVIPYSWATRARRHEVVPEGDVECGLDVSAGAADRTVMWARRGQRALKKWVWRGYTDPKDLAELIVPALVECHATSVKVDSIGVGWGVGGILDVMSDNGLHACTVVPVNVSERAEDDEHFYNKRAEIWWDMREACRTNAIDLSAVDDDDLDELTAPKYHTRNPRGRIQVEKKEDIIKRLGKSPDSADALNLAFHVQDYPMESFVDQIAQARLP